MIEIKDYSFSYNKNSILKSINLKIEDSKLTALMGVNGSGKTTLLKNILGSLKSNVGEITIDGKNINDFSFSNRSKLFSYIPQSIEGIFNFYAIDVVLFGLAGELSPIKVPGKKEIKKAERVFNKLGIEYLKHQKLHEMSGGERQMVLIARSLIRETPYLIMDEPTSSLDYRNQINVMEIAKKISSEGTTVIISTHNPSFALFYSDNAVLLKSGEVYRSGKSKDVIDEDNLSYIFDRHINFAVINGEKIIYP